MSLFCLLWIPIFYFFRRSISEERNSKSGWALFLGSLSVVIMFFFDDLVQPAGFGLSRWLHGFFDIVSFPVLVPFLICILLAALKIFPFDVHFTGFTLLWLVPLAIYRAGDWSYMPYPILLVVVPLLWTFQIAGIGFFLDCIFKKPKWFIIVPCCIGIIALPLIATTAWWDFFASRYFNGLVLLSVCSLPMFISLVFSGINSNKAIVPPKFL